LATIGLAVTVLQKNSNPHINACLVIAAQNALVTHFNNMIAYYSQVFSKFDMGREWGMPANMTIQTSTLYLQSAFVCKPSTVFSFV